MRILTIFAALLVLAGCAGAPVGWGGSHEVTLANERAITIVYDPLMGGYDAANRTASTHCKKYGRAPVPTVKGNRGVLTEQVFECR